MKSSEEAGTLRVGLNRIHLRRLPAHTQAPAPTILGLHGFTGSGEDYFPLREALGTDSANWILPDWPGHGRSSAPVSIEAYQLPACMAMLRASLRWVPSGSPLVLLAYSMGGRIAWHGLPSLPLTRTFLIGASPGLREVGERAKRRDRDEQWIHLLEKEGLAAFAQAWEAQELIRPQTELPEPLRSHIARRRRENSVRGLVLSLRASGAGTLPSLWSQLKNGPPACLLTGEKDVKFRRSAGEIIKAYPEFQHIPIPDCGHAPHLEAPSRMATILRPLLP